MINGISVIVLTPVKNEEWILESFLKITSSFADHIIILDQLSTDNTPKIVKQFPKVTYLINNNDDYDEAIRQKTLIYAARKLVAGRKLLLALDADEIIEASSIYSKEWNVISQLSPGTQVLFNKPDVLPGFEYMYDYNAPFLLGYIDDGALHTGSKFHSPRLPKSEIRYIAKDILFLHLALVREKEYLSRQVLYSMLENINGSEKLYLRYRKYSPRIQKFLRNKFRVKLNKNCYDYSPENIDLGKIVTKRNSIYIQRILDIFKAHGCRRFWWDDIWFINYKKLNNQTGSNAEIVYPPFYINSFRNCILWLYVSFLKFKTIRRHFSSNQDE